MFSILDIAIILLSLALSLKGPGDEASLTTKKNELTYRAPYSSTIPL